MGYPKERTFLNNQFEQVTNDINFQFRVAMAKAILNGHKDEILERQFTERQKEALQQIRKGQKWTEEIF